MLEIQTYFKINDDFISLDEYEGNIPDSLYIEGAVEIIVEDLILLSTAEWDYVDQTWAYFVNGLEEVRKGQTFSTYLPDQPVEIIFKPTDDKKEVQISVKVYSIRQATVPYTSFMTKMSEEAKRFFTRLGQLLPDDKSFYDQMVRRIDELI